MASSDERAEEVGVFLGARRTPYDSRPAIERLDSGEFESAWAELWDELHHQGDVDVASFAAVPALVRWRRQSGRQEWNFYALVATIELARDQGANPDVPEWLRKDYEAALAECCDFAIEDLKSTTAAQVVRGALAMVALSKGLRPWSELLLNLSSDEVGEFLAREA